MDSPLVTGIDELGQKVFVTLEGKIRAMYKKYAKTFIDIEDELKKTQDEFIEISNKLRGSEKDLAAIKGLQKLLEE